jgi:hypothetical protein
MATNFVCIDDPTIIHEKQWCVSPVSKDARGELQLIDSKAHQCHTPACSTSTPFIG